MRRERDPAGFSSVFGFPVFVHKNSNPAEESSVSHASRLLSSTAGREGPRVEEILPNLPKDRKIGGGGGGGL